MLATLGGAGAAIAQSGDNPSDVAAGEAVFASSCAGCHGSDGTGVVGLGRPLIGIAAQGDRAAHVDAIANGKGAMPAFGDKLSEGEVGEVASYVRLTFVEAAADDPTELAATGVSSVLFTLLGVTMLVGGWLMLLWSRAAERKAG